jgi:hypothetical protein
MINSRRDLVDSHPIVIMYRTTGYTLSTLNKNVTGLILDYLPYIDLIHLGTSSKSFNKKITSWCGFHARKSTALLMKINTLCHYEIDH